MISCKVKIFNKLSVFEYRLIEQRILVNFLDKATKSVRWMTRFKTPMKDVENNEMLWGAVPSLDPQVSEWGNPLNVMVKYLSMNL